MDRPEYLQQGEVARLFPVLATTSKEGRTTSIVLACMSKVDEFGAALLGSIGQRLGKRSRMETYTEIVFIKEKAVLKDRPDGLIVVKTGQKEWRALVEAKIGSAVLDPDQIERYRQLAKDHGVDCLITISNQFATTPTSHPLEEVRKSRSKIPVFHWSWSSVLTAADLLLKTDVVEDVDQKILLNELRRFLTHESAGIKGFDRMPPEWSELNKLVTSGGRVPTKSAEAVTVLNAWHQECRDLSLILSRQTETTVTQRLPRKHLQDPAERQKDELARLRDYNQLSVVLDIPDSAAPLEVVADLKRRTVEVGMTLRAPEDKKSSKARVAWLTRQIKTEKTADIFVRLNWPGRSEATQIPFEALKADPSLAEKGKDGLQVLSFHIYTSRQLGAKFIQQTNFISEIETIVPSFYKEIGQNLVEWRKSAPRIKDDRQTADDVDVEALAQEAEEEAQ